MKALNAIIFMVICHHSFALPLTTVRYSGFFDTDVQGIWACEGSQKCVKWNLCRSNGTIATDGSFLIKKLSDFSSKPAKLICLCS